MNSEKNSASKQEEHRDIQQNMGIYEDGINPMDYFRVIWKRKWFIFLWSVLPTLIAGLILFLLPRSYKVTYVYDVRDNIGDGISNWNLNETNYNILLGKFYSKENLEKIIDKFRRDGFESCAKKLGNISDGPEKYVEFKAIPTLTGLSSLNVTDPNQFERIKNRKASLLNVTITGECKEDMYQISSVIRDNIENVLPLYMIQEQLSTNIRDYKNALADIERSRFNLELILKNNNEILTGLRNVNVGAPGSKEGDVMLQFDIGEQKQYLPVGHQIQAAESKRVELEANVKTDEEKYKYHKGLVDLNERVLVELGEKLSSDYSIMGFKSFLEELGGGYDKRELKDYLNSYVKKIENRISVSRPISESPKIHVIARGTIRKSGIIFGILLLMSVFVAFVREGFQKSQDRFT
ncbi:MAG: Wzz/FepE/Etk N-terminal domain-containing protein [Planctomycetota bacterium]